MLTTLVMRDAFSLIRSEVTIESAGYIAPSKTSNMHIFDEPLVGAIYRAKFVIITESDWTSFHLKSGGEILNVRLNVTEGYDAPKLNYFWDVNLNFIYVGKSQFDPTKVKLEANVLLSNLTEEVIFEIQKGDMEYTTVEIYNLNAHTPLKAITNSLNVPNNGKNPMQFSALGGELVSSDPISLKPRESQVPKLVWAAYYPWYTEDTWRTYAEILIDTPLIGAYSSSNPTIIETHIRQAKSAGIDGFIVSWKGNGSRTDRNLETILNVASKHDFKIAIYFESLQGGQPRSKENLQEMLCYFFEKYGQDERYYRIDNLPVIFLYAVNSQPLSVWREIIANLTDRGYVAKYITTTTRPEYLEVFDGLNIYSIVRIEDLNRLYKQLALICRSYPILFEEEKNFIWCATISPGYDDRKAPGRAGTYQPREGGNYYEMTFDVAINSSPDWIFITSFNEWWENTHIEPSEKYGYEYLNLTAEFTSKFKP